MTDDERKALATLVDYVERSTHWREGGATRHDAKLALKVLSAEPGPSAQTAPKACWACGGTRKITTSSNGSGLIEVPCDECASKSES